MAAGPDRTGRRSGTEPAPFVFIAAGREGMIVMTRAVNNLNVSSFSPLMPPRRLREQLPLSEGAAEKVADAREEIAAILEGRDSRMLVIAGRRQLWR